MWYSKLTDEQILNFLTHLDMIVLMIAVLYEVSVNTKNTQSCWN